MNIKSIWYSFWCMDYIVVDEIMLYRYCKQEWTVLNWANDDVVLQTKLIWYYTVTYIVYLGKHWSISPRLSKFNAFQLAFFEISELLLSKWKFHAPIVFECHCKTWFDIRLLAHQEFVDVSHRLHATIIGTMWKRWISQQSDIKSCFPMPFADNWWNFHFERSNPDISKNAGWKALNCESRGEIDHWNAVWSNLDCMIHFCTECSYHIRNVNMYWMVHVHCK